MAQCGLLWPWSGGWRCVGLKPFKDETRPGTAEFGPTAGEKDDTNGDARSARASDKERDSAADVGRSSTDGGTRTVGKVWDEARSIRLASMLLMHLCLCCACVLVCMYGE